MRVRWRALVCVVSFVLAACGPIVEPVVLVPCPSGTCWDLSAGTPLGVNDAPSEGVLSRDEAHAWRFDTVPGHRYLVLTRVFVGSADTYVSFSPLIDPYTQAMVDVGSSEGLSFTATAYVAFIAVADRGNDAGTDYTVRVVSYDERLDPLPGTTSLAINAPPVPRALAPAELARYVFSAVRGTDSTIRVQTTRGAVLAFASLIPSVDDDFYDLTDASNVMTFRATETGRYYVAVLDRGGAAGSEFTIQVTSP